jgi:hypothetical protein
MQDDSTSTTAAAGPVLSEGLGPAPVAWMAEFVTACESTETQFYTQDPNGLRFNDAGDPSPFRVTPLYDLASIGDAEAAERERLQDELQTKREALQRASAWLHAAYNRPPQTPECIAMLAEVDAACDFGA